MKILMVEDDKSVSQMMELFFKKEGWEQVSAYDGEEAVEIFQIHPRDFDIITLDLNLPKKDGIQVAKEIRRFLVGPKECEVTGITFTPDTALAVDSLYLEQSELGIFADEFFQAFAPDSLQLPL